MNLSQAQDQDQDIGQGVPVKKVNSQLSRQRNIKKYQIDLDDDDRSAPLNQQDFTINSDQNLNTNLLNKNSLVSDGQNRDSRLSEGSFVLDSDESGSNHQNSQHGETP